MRSPACTRSSAWMSVGNTRRRYGVRGSRYALLSAVLRFPMTMRALPFRLAMGRRAYAAHPNRNRGCHLGRTWGRMVLLKNRIVSARVLIEPVGILVIEHLHCPTTARFRLLSEMKCRWVRPAG